MGFLGYDSDRLDLLHRALDRACADLADARVRADPAEAFDAVTSCIRSMTIWNQRIRSLIANPAMTTAAQGPKPFTIDFGPQFPLRIDTGPPAPAHYGPGEIAADDFANVLLYSKQQQGWTIATDPTPDVALTPDEQSMADEALATSLRDGDPKVTLAGPSGEAIRRQLADIAADTRRSRDFAAALGDQGLTKLADDAARRWHDSSGPGGDQRARDRAQADIGLLADIIDCGRASKNAPLPAALTTTMDPQAAAMLLSQLDVDGATLGCYAAAILQRWHTDPPAGQGPWIVSTNETDNGPGALLFAAMKTVPGAPASFVGSARTMDEPMRLMVLYGSVADAADYESVMTQATDPAFVSVSQAKAILLTILGDYRAHDPTPVSTDQRSDTSILGALSAPWLMELANIDPGFDLTDSEGVALLQYVFSDGPSRMAILNAASAIASDVVDPLSPPEDWEALMNRLDAIQTLKGILDKTALKQTLDDEEKSDLGVEFWLTISQKVASYAAGALTAGTTTSIVNVAVSRAEALIADTSLSDGPSAAMNANASSVDTRRNAEMYQLVTSLYVAATGYGATSDTATVEDPPPRPRSDSHCSAKQYAADLDKWIDGLPPGDLKKKMGELRREVLHGYANGYNCA